MSEDDLNLRIVALDLAVKHLDGERVNNYEITSLAQKFYDFLVGA